MGALPFFHPRHVPPTPDLIHRAPRETPVSELIETSRSHPIRGLLIAVLLATIFWGTFFVALYFLLR
jgi:hypothetical protein